jgi:hypothetical protein
LREESAGPAQQPQRKHAGRVPDFFIVGHQKCGTTALYEMLRRRPQIFMSEVKEPRYVLLYTDHVRYVEQLRRFRDLFGVENVLVISYDDFRRENESTVREVLRFLGVDDTLPVETIDTKPLKAVRSLPLHRLANAARLARNNPAAAGLLGKAVNALTPKVLRSESVRGLWRGVVYRSQPAPDEAFMRELRSRLKPEVEAISEYLGRDLVSEWGYDGLPGAW